ncbi:hypothetical protein ACQUQU_18500 [Thalassolituus sp. LLYu03]|uniref:hypothetical protein n=1 Tax=Thalassolituus sp. LLYu03 TaxID=3421656 RepID=UPI003D2D1463
MANTFGQSYGLTTLCPLINGTDGHSAFDKLTRHHIQRLAEDEGSPFTKVPNTYFARLFILNDVFFQQGNSVARDHLKSKYLVFTSNFHGDLDTYLRGMWNNAEADVRAIWQYAVAFDKVQSADDFVAYIKKCQLTTSLFFNGSNDISLAEQLKSLYVKQAFSEFAMAHQGKPAAELRAAFSEFLARVQLDNLSTPSWQPGQTELTSMY